MPLIPVALVQTRVCYVFALLFGFELTGNIPLVILANIPRINLFVFIGLLCGALFNDKMIGEVCGALLTSLSAGLLGALN